MRDPRDLYAGLFAALPSPHLAVTPDWQVFDANPAYLDLVGLRREDVVGVSIRALFPPSPDSSDADGTPFVLLSFMHAARERRPDRVPVARYDTADRVTGAVAEPYWSHVAVPVLDGDEVVLVVQVLTEVTDDVLARQVGAVSTGAAQPAWAEAVEIQLPARPGEVRAARDAEQEVPALREALAEAALGVAAAAQDIGAPNTPVLARGLATVVAAVASLGVRDGETVPLTVTPGAPAVAGGVGEVPLSSPLISTEPEPEPEPEPEAEAEAEAAGARTTRALQTSQALQRSLLGEPTQHPGCTVTARYRPVGPHARIGGEWFDSFASSAGLAHLVVGDVSGRDQDAAAMMGQARDLLRGIAHTVDEPPAAVVRRVDRAMADLGTGEHAALLLARLDRPHSHGARRVRWTDAGHPAPLVVRSDGHVELLDTGPELMLGVDPGARRSDHETVLQPGETLLMFTAGLLERRGQDLGLDRLVDTVTAAAGAGLHGAGLCDHLLDLMADRAEDDIALLALEVDLAPADPRAGPDRTDRDDLWQPAATPPVPPPARQWPLTDLRGLAEVRRSARQLLLATAVPAGATAPADPDAVEDTVAQVVLVIDELASSALRHGRPPARLEVFDREDSWVVIAADAAADRLPEPAVDRPATEGGHGLYLIADLSVAHGVDVTDQDKQVWAEVPKPRSAP